VILLCHCAPAVGWLASGSRGFPPPWGWQTMFPYPSSRPRRLESSLTITPINYPYIYCYLYHLLCHLKKNIIKYRRKHRNRQKNRKKEGVTYVTYVITDFLKKIVIISISSDFCQMQRVTRWYHIYINISDCLSIFPTVLDTDLTINNIIVPSNCMNILCVNSTQKNTCSEWVAHA
jgi:hypothetical protein